MSDIEIHPPQDFKAMHKAGRLAAETLDFIAPYVKPGISTGHLDRLCQDFMEKNGGIPATIGYRGYPKASCISVNHVVCHGIPDNNKLLKNGDILNIDVTPIVDGWHGDTSRMFYAGKVGRRAEKLTQVTYDCLMYAIDAVKPGTHLGDIGHIIQTHAEKNRFSVVIDFCGHGLGRTFHAAPSVLHAGKKGTGPILEEGMFFTIEPMINAGKPSTKILADGWTAVTRDRSLTAQFEHSIGVTADGSDIFTLSPKGWHCPPYE